MSSRDKRDTQGRTAPKTHRHKSRPVYKLVGCSETAPSYHLEACTVSKCKVKRITFCPHTRGDREVHLGLKPVCSICDKEV